MPVAVHRLELQRLGHQLEHHVLLRYSGGLLLFGGSRLHQCRGLWCLLILVVVESVDDPNGATEGSAAYMSVLM